MSKRKSFVLRIDPELFKQVEKWADDEFRSVNGQLEWIIHKSLKDSNRLPRKRNKKTGGSST
ncbi:MAG: Arc family DNA-binding protein [Robiginitalea sp.]